MIRLRDVSKRYAGQPPAVTGLSLDVAEGELCVLIGPSGCGKTTTLKMINRLIEPSAGEIVVDGQNVLRTDPSALRRKIGYVMQQGGLFPHRRVGDNVATVPRLLGWPKDKVRARVDELLALVGLDPGLYARRYPRELSGGERQRVGVARALGGDPPVLLMDEPFGAVDPITRTRLQEEFLALQQRLSKTVVFVTHDIDEATALGTRIALLSPGGILEQYGTPTEVLGRPASPFVAEFVGAERGLHRLAVAKVATEDLTQAPRLRLEQSFAEANALLHRTGYRLGLAVDARSGATLGWVARAEEGAEGAGAVSAHLRPFSATTPLGATLQEALAAMLQNDDGFTAVTDGDAVVGVLTPDDLHAAMRRTLGPPGAAPPAGRAHASLR